MMREATRSHFGLRALGVAVALWGVAAGCDRADSNHLQGYVEGEFVYVAAALAGTLESLHVQRGAQVQAGDALFALDSAPEQAEVDEAKRRLAQAQATAEDVKKGRRPSEIDSVQAQLKQAQAALALAEKELARQEELFRAQMTTERDVDRARATFDQARERVAQLDADLSTARLGSRKDQIAAAEDEVRAREAVLAKAEWALAQKRRVAPQAGLVFETLYRAGEWVAAGRPVVALLPPQNVKVRAFVPETRIGTVHTGDRVRVTVDGVAEPINGTVSFISPQAEYTPPVIYSQENRGKLMFMIEAAVDPAAAATLHPGQPVDVELTS
jgi:HlyD family secretion protein